MKKIAPKPDKDGFYSIKDKLPIEYDLCHLIGKNGKHCMGWRVSNERYDGMSIERIDEVIAWKKKKEM